MRTNLLLLLFLLILSLSNGLCNPVKITLALLGNTAATLLLVLLENLDLLESLHNLAVYAAAGIDVLGGAGAAVLGAAVDLAETADTDGLSEIDVAGNRSGTDVEPVNVLGRHLLGRAGLDGVDPTGYRELALALQESRVGIDELVSLSPSNKLD
jgi:hypothetical protein